MLVRPGFGLGLSTAGRSRVRDDISGRSGGGAPGSKASGRGTRRRVPGRTLLDRARENTPANRLLKPGRHARRTMGTTPETRGAPGTRGACGPNRCVITPKDAGGRQAVQESGLRMRDRHRADLDPATGRECAGFAGPGQMLHQLMLRTETVHRGNETGIKALRAMATRLHRQKPRDKPSNRRDPQTPKHALGFALKPESYEESRSRSRDFPESFPRLALEPTLWSLLWSHICGSPNHLVPLLPRRSLRRRDIYLYIQRVHL